MPSVIIAPDCSIHAFVRVYDLTTRAQITSNRHFTAGDVLNVTPHNADALVHVGAATVTKTLPEAPEVVVMNEMACPGWRPAVSLGR